MAETFPWYTGDGDDGTTGLLGEGRVPKHHPQPEAFGTVDEASSLMGLARAVTGDDEVNGVLIEAQRDCYTMMAELAATKDAQMKFRRITAERVQWVSETTTRFGTRVSMPREFVCPGDSQAGATLDVARAVSRRAERCVSRLLDDDVIENRDILAYLNRLSSLLFALARYMDARSGASAVTLAKRTPDNPSGA